MTSQIYTAITFSPVQDFIEKSRKLRDLYGSSIILSYLADALCTAAREYFQVGEQPQWPDDPIISPARIDVARGTPNVILIRGEFPKATAQKALNRAWQALVLQCRTWIEANVTTSAGDRWQYTWSRSWQEWVNHCWELFWATGTTMDEARKNMNQVKYPRDWTSINWVGESSTLSGQDSRAWPSLGYHKSHERSRPAEEAEVREFYAQLSKAITGRSMMDGADSEVDSSIITLREQLSIPELVKRLVTIEDVIGDHTLLELPKSFKLINRWQPRTQPDDDTADGNEEADRDKAGRWTGWFQGDGDRAGKLLEAQARGADSETAKETVTHTFSQAMREWGAKLHTHLPRTASDRKRLDRDGRIIYAGGDDFLGVLYRNPPADPLIAKECLAWLYTFKPSIWSQHKQPISVSVGFVWAAPNVPQRDVLQHCREAEKSAKAKGRDRLAIRILFNGGNHLEWVCPWRFLPVLQDYCDRSSNTDQWTHIYNDVAALENRHAMPALGTRNAFKDSATGIQSVVALRLFQVYFQAATAQQNAQSGISQWQECDREQFYQLMDGDELDLNHPALWNDEKPDTAEVVGGILGEKSAFETGLTDAASLDEDRVRRAFNQWIIDLAKVGFHLCRKPSNI